MRNRFYQCIIFAIFCAIAIFSLTVAQSYDYGAPAGYTGSPHDGKSCVSCHTGSPVTAVSGWITSNIPPTGYTPDSIYTITATATLNGINTFGFEVSPQDSASGTILGTLVVTNSAQTALAGSGYITQTLSGISGTGSKSWSFNWVAPHAGNGTVTFYGAFNCANGNSKKSGDLIYTSQLKVQEGPTGIAPVAYKTLQCSVYPNPTANLLHVQFTAGMSSTYNVALYGEDGRCICNKSLNVQPLANVAADLDLTSDRAGCYLLRISGDREYFQEKVFKIQ